MLLHLHYGGDQGFHRLSGDYLQEHRPNPNARHMRATCGSCAGAAPRDYARARCRYESMPRLVIVMCVPGDGHVCAS